MVNVAPLHMETVQPSQTHNVELVSEHLTEGDAFARKGAATVTATAATGDGALSAKTSRLWVDTSSTAIGARTTSVLKYLEHRNTCVGLAVQN